MQVSRSCGSTDANPQTDPLPAASPGCPGARSCATIPPLHDRHPATRALEQPTHYLGDLFRVSKTRGDKTLGAVCKLWTHALGWEVRLEINDDLQRSEVFRSQDDVLTAGETWKAAMIEKGWQ